jgi:hypothetical protein
MLSQHLSKAYLPACWLYMITLKCGPSRLLANMTARVIIHAASPQPSPHLAAFLVNLTCAMQNPRPLVHVSMLGPIYAGEEPSSSHKCISEDIQSAPISETSSDAPCRIFAPCLLHLPTEHGSPWRSVNWIGQLCNRFLAPSGVDDAGRAKPLESPLDTSLGGRAGLLRLQSSINSNNNCRQVVCLVCDTHLVVEQPRTICIIPVCISVLSSVTVDIVLCCRSLFKGPKSYLHILL